MTEDLHISDLCKRLAASAARARMLSVGSFVVSVEGIDAVLGSEGCTGVS